MITLAASRGLFQSPALRIFSWAKKGYKSSGPVRYVPGAYNQIKKTEKFPYLEVLEKKEANLVKSTRFQGARSGRRASSFDEDEFEGKIFDAEFMEPSDLFKQQGDVAEPRHGPLDLMDSDIRNKSKMLLYETPTQNTHGSKSTKQNEAITTKLRQDVETTAIELLAARAFTAVELRKKLCGKKYPVPIVDSVIADIKCRGLLNDGLYAEAFSRSRWLSSNWGPRRIKQALIQKGVSKVEADKATKQVFEDDDLNGSDDSSKFGMSKLAMDRLFLQASKQWLRGQETPLEKRNARIVRWLQYRGFNWGITSYILKKLQSEFPP